MDAHSFPLAAWSHACAGVLYGALAVHLIRRQYGRRDRHKAAWALLAAVLSSSLWGWLSAGRVLTGDAFFEAAAPLADVLRSACWFTFLLALVRPSGDDKSFLGGSLVAGAVASTAFAVAAQFLSLLGIDPVWNSTRLVLMAPMALAIFGLMLVEQLFRNLRDDARWNAKPLCLALCGMFLFDLYVHAQAVLFNEVDMDAVDVRGAVHALTTPLLLLATRRHPDWLSRLHLSRNVAFHSAAVVIASVYLVFLAAVGYYVRFFGGDWGRAVQVGLVFCGLMALVVVAVSGSVRAWLKVFVGRNFYRHRFDYREAWLRFTQTLSAQDTSQALGLQVIRGLADMVESPAGALWTKAGEASYVQAARWNTELHAGEEHATAPLCMALLATGRVLDLDEHRGRRGAYAGVELPAWLAAMTQAWLVVPLRMGAELTGFAVLVRARAPMDVNWEVDDLLKTAGCQAASFLTQMRATEALLEARRFEAFNRMSAFVVHDLKNIVTQLSLMMTNARRLHDNAEFRQDMLMTVENSLVRMRKLMLQLREGDGPVAPGYGVDVRGVVQRIAAAASSQGRQLEVNLRERLVTTGDGERLERIIGHVVQNAFDATPASGRVWVRLDRFRDHARIEVGDSGAGMSQEFLRDRLFKPFETTKAEGMGIGVYESFQYVRELGGTMLVNSRLGVGTEVTILLPLADDRADIATAS